MAKEKKEKEVKVVESEESTEVVTTKKVEFPTIGGNGRFQMIPFKDGFVIYNPVGQRATGIVDEIYAKDMVARSNRAIGIKG